MAGPDEELSPEEEAERTRRLRRLSALVQAGGAVFLAVAALGLLPRILAAWFPGIGPRAATAAWILAPILPLALLGVAALRLRR
jgi:hypothetical protein